MAFKFLLASLCFLCTAVKCQYNFEINGEIQSGDFNGQKVHLIIRDLYSSTRYEIEDSCVIVNNKFRFKGRQQKPTEWALLSMPKSSHFTEVALDSGMSTVIMKKLPKNSKTWKNQFSNPEVLSSASNLLIKKINQLHVHYFTTKAIKSDKKSSILRLSPQNARQLNLDELQILKDGKNLYFGLIQLYKLVPKMQTEIDSVHETFLTFDTTIRQTKLGLELADKIAAVKQSLIGMQMPGFSAYTSTGEIFESTKLKGQTVLLVFGATWCLPCKENYPVLKKIYSKYHPQGLELIAITLDEDSTKWQADIKKYDLPWINISEKRKWEENKVVRKFNVNLIPMNMLIDKNGKIIYNSIQMKDGNNELLEVFIKKSLTSLSPE